MHVQYGSYQHDPGEVMLAVTKETLWTDDGLPYAVRERWNLSGMLVGDSEADIDAKVAAMDTAYSTSGQDLIVKLTSGGDTRMALRSADCIGGTRVVSPPAFPENRDAAYVTFLPYTVAVEGVVALPNTERVVISFAETITKSGGGPRYGVIETIAGLPVRQKLRNYTTFRAQQSGSATGLFAMPLVPPPLWPQALVEAPEIRTDPPRVHRSGKAGYTHFTVHWNYRFESPLPLVGGGNVWGTV